MENLKIRVNSEAESKEAQELFFELGYGFEGCKIKTIQHLEYTSDYYFFAYAHDMDLTHSCDYGVFINKAHKETTLPELRDLVVLKRNNVADATHYTKGSLGACLFKNYVGEKTYAWHKKVWQEQPTAPYLLHPISDLKPIEKPMKEYLRKNSNGTYSYIGTVRPEHVSDFMIEIPDGAIKAYLNNSKTINFVNSDDDYMNHVTKGEWVSTHRGMHEKCGHVLVWSRHTHPEELPFIDDEPLQSLNDQYAEIEKVRQSAWQKQEGGSHYKTLKIQPMQYALENKLDYAQANVVKYVTRHKEKNGKEDLLKAIHNIELMIEFYYGGGE